MKSVSKRSTTHKYFLIGGPYAGQWAYLPTVTIVFSVQGYHGRYDGGRWQEYV